jgi:nucleoid-associated protein YgaU
MDTDATIEDPQLSSLIGALNAAIGNVTTFANASQSTINSVLQPLTAVQARVQELIAINDAVVASAPGFAGIVAGARPGDSVAALATTTATMFQLVSLFKLRAFCGRMANNLAAVNASDSSLTTAGGNLFQIASQQYGDPAAWTGIAKANGIIDPFLHGVNTLVIPPQADDSGGILD